VGLHTDVTNPRLRDLVNTAIVSEPVVAQASTPVVDTIEVDEHLVDLAADPFGTMADDHIRVAKPNRTRSKRR
jgi:hypothetical protein